MRNFKLATVFAVMLIATPFLGAQPATDASTLNRRLQAYREAAPEEVAPVPATTSASRDHSSVSTASAPVPRRSNHVQSIIFGVVAAWLLIACLVTLIRFGR